jgi:protein-disulfide isomerase
MRFAKSALLGAATLAGVLVLPLTGQAQPAFSAQQRQAIEQIVKDYLVKNPEVLQEALTELERRQQERQKTAQATALTQEREKLLNSPRNNVVGNPSGDVTLVEFFDYNCGYCKRALGDLQTLMRADPKLRVVLRDFPVLGPESVEASRVALAVRQQIQGDRLFEYHTKLLETRGPVNGARALAVAREMGLDVDRIKKDMESPEVRAALQENVGLGDKLGLSGTPAFVVGDTVVSGAVGADPLRQAIAGVRQCGKAVC